MGHYSSPTDTSDGPLFLARLGCSCSAMETHSMKLS
ncbi:unnamed protein product, partial [Staurois parvus]